MSTFDILIPLTGMGSGTIQSSNLTAESVYSAYSTATNYAVGDTVTLTANHRDYQAVASGANHHPTAAGATAYWSDLGYNNQYKQFDDLIESQTQNTALLTERFNVTAGFDTFAALNMDARTITLTLSEQETNVIVNGEFCAGTISGWDICCGATNDTTAAFGQGHGPGNSCKVVGTVSGFCGIKQTLTLNTSKQYIFNGYPATECGDTIKQYEVRINTGTAVGTSLANQTGQAVSGSYQFNVLSTLTITPTKSTVTVAVGYKNPDATTNSIAWDSVELLPLSQKWYTSIDLHVDTATDQITDLYFTGIAASAGQMLDISVAYSGNTAKVGKFVMGRNKNLGTTLYSPELSILDYSKKSTDSNGLLTITKGSFSKFMSMPVKVNNSSVDSVMRTLSYYRSTLLCFRGAVGYNSMVVYGITRNFNILLSYPDISILNIEVEGVI